MKNIKTRLLCLVLALVMLLSCLVACDLGEATKPSDETLIKKRITSFVSAYNDGDLEAVIACLDRGTRTELEAWINILKGVTGKLVGISFNLSDLFAIGAGLSGSMSGDDEILKVQIREIKIAQDGTAEANAILKSGKETLAVCFQMEYSEEEEGWFIHDMVERELTDEELGGGATSEGNQSLKSTDTVVKLDRFFDGRAVVEFKRNGTYMYGVIDTTGKLIYASQAKWTHIGKGAGYTQDSNANINIVNAKGEVTASSKDGLFDSVLAYGDGMVLVYRYVSNVSSQSWLCGVLDSQGEWVFPMSNMFRRIHPDYVRYLGSGVFALGYDYETGYLWSCNDQTQTMYSGEAVRLNFIDGVAYSNRELSLHIDGNFEKLPDNYALKSDGTFEALSIDLSEGELDHGYFIFERGGYVGIQNLATGKTIPFREYSADMVEEIVVNDASGVFLIRLEGVDGNDYFTMINESGKMLFEPIRYIRYSNRTIYFSEGMICCNLSTSGGMSVVDKTGKVVVSADEEYTQIYGFCNGIALVRKGEWDPNYKFIDKTGKTILSDYAT